MSLEGQIALDRIIKWIIKGLILITLIDISKISQTWSEETEDLDYVSLADRIVKCRYTNFEEKCWFPHLIRPTPLPAATVHSMLGVSTVVVDAVVGKSTSLPCDVEPDSKEDRVYMVLWFRHTGGKPLYSFDVRGRPYIKALHWSDPLAFGRRAYFVTIARPASLTIEIVQLDDEGIYRCRVDFKNSPTRNFQIKLNVIVPPHQMLLYDEAGRDMAGVIGPLEEGANFTLLCELRGGRPQPTLRWLMNNTVIEKHTVLKNDGKVIVSKISMTGADRTWLNSSIRCQANNTHLLSPHERSARIEMNLRPESVRITNKPLEMSADRHVTLVCVSHGSHPQAQITWYRDNRRFIKGKIEEFTNDTTTVSRLVIVPQPEDDGVVIKCRAENTLLSVALEDYFRMTVVYKPVVSVTLGRNLNAQEIKEGDDVYFECNIKANPKQYRIDWYHHKQDKHVKVKSNLTKITNEVFRGTYFSGQSLIIKMITKNDGGLYSCRVANDMGEVTSSELYLRVLYAPLCTQDNVVTVGVSLDKTVKVRCTVSAEPADVTFTWQFNHSSDSFQVSPARYGEYVASGGTASELRYNAASERDYGTLSCRGRNAIGEQKKPCVFNVIPAARPDPPRNCSATKIPRHSEPYLAVHCYAGYDGGLKQHFILEITGEPTEVLVNTTVNQPGFYDPSQNVDVWMNVTWSMLENIEADQALAVIASNSKGSADPVILQGLVFKTSDKIKEGATAGSMQIHVVAALVAVATLLAVGAVLAAIALKKRPETTTTVTSKRPSQSVIQVDSQGRRYLIAYPATSEKETKPDILNPKPDNAPPRVVLESDDGETFTLRELRPGRSNQPPQPSDAVVRHARINN